MYCVNPDAFKQFGEITHESFYLAITRELKDVVSVKTSRKYSSVHCIIVPAEKDFYEVVQSLPEDAHIVWIPFGRRGGAFSRRGSIKANQKLMTFLCMNAPVTIDMVLHFLKVLEKTNPDQQVELAEKFFDKLSRAQFVEFINTQYATKATLEIDFDCLWSEMYGYIPKGWQQLVPNGEVALTHQKNTPENFDPLSALKISGSVIFQGCPLLSRQSTEPYITNTELMRIYKELEPLRTGGTLQVVLKNGMITDLLPLTSNAESAKRMLEALFAVDERYRTLFEIGFGFNTAIELYPGNCVMNEAYAGVDGCVHFGIGAEITNYHFDIICPGTQVISSAGETLIKASDGGLNRKPDSACPCV